MASGIPTESGRVIGGVEPRSADPNYDLILTKLGVKTLSAQRGDTSSRGKGGGGGRKREVERTPSDCEENDVN